MERGNSSNENTTDSSEHPALRGSAEETNKAPVEARPLCSRTARPAAGRGHARPVDTLAALGAQYRGRGHHGRALARKRGCGPTAPPSASATGRCATSTGCGSTAPPSPAGSAGTPMARRSRPRHGRDQPRHRFRSKPADPRKQAAGVIKRLQGSRIKSVGTARNYQERLVQIAARLDVALTALTPDWAVAYLKGRAAEVGHKTLDMERQAIQAMMVNITGKLPPGTTPPVVKSVEPHRPKPRAYSPAQVRAVAARQDPRNALATEIAHASGIRAHELLTLRRPEEQPPHDQARPVAPDRHRRRGHEVPRSGRRGLHRCREGRARPRGAVAPHSPVRKACTSKPTSSLRR